MIYIYDIKVEYVIKRTCKSFTYLVVYKNIASIAYSYLIRKNFASAITLYVVM